MSLWHFLLRSLAFHWRMHMAVALGVAAATAVLTGALLVGDSVRGSLRHLALDRLGKIDQVLVTDRFFREKMAADFAKNRTGSQVAPAILFPAVTAERTATEGRRRAAGVMLVGCDDAFWQLGSEKTKPQKTPDRGEIVLNSALAQELEAKVGDQVIIRLPKSDQIPADSALGKKQDRLTSLADLKVIEIIRTESLGRFSLQPMQTSPRNAYVALEEIQSALFVGEEEKEKVNAMLVGGVPYGSTKKRAGKDSLTTWVTPTLADYGLALKRVRRTFKGVDGKETTIFDYYSLSSDRLLVDDQIVKTVWETFPDKARPVFTYLANTIEKVGEQDESKKPIPYSLISAIDPAPGGPLSDREGQPLPPLQDDEIALSSWAADDLQAKIGDIIRLTYFAPETTHGQTIERSVELKLAAIIPVTQPSSRYVGKRPAEFSELPTPANDPDLTPEVRGFTDQETISQADPPFPYDRTKIRKPKDDEYWAYYRTTPKAYVSLKTGQRLWHSRFGQVTSVRIDASVAADQIALENRLLKEFQPHAGQLGFTFLPLRRQSEDASGGTTPFDVLFLLLSMFIIAAALMLVWILFRLGVEQRASEIGTLQALGWPAKKTARVLALEGAIVAAAGGLVGSLLGIGYAWLMITGLRTWWVGAVATPFLELHITALSLFAGYASGVIVCVITIYLSLRALRKVPARSLLAGEVAADLRFEISDLRRKADATSNLKSQISNLKSPSRYRWTVLIAPALVLISLALAVLATQLGGEAQAGAFMGAGAAMLAALLIFIAGRLKAKGSGLSTTGLARTAFRNAGRNVGRSVTTIALMASASFLIVAVSAFQLDPSEEGVGGFDYLAESSEPILADLNSPAARKQLLRQDAKNLEGATILSFRLRSGDDASCRNLYQPHQPRVLGVTTALVDYFNEQDGDRKLVHFKFAASAAKSSEERENPWHLLNTAAAEGQPVNVFLDKNTAMYSLKLYRGIGEEFAFDYGEGPPVKFRVAGLLSNSVLQGGLLIGEADFKQLFPTISGYRSFLIKAPSDPEKVVTFLEDRFGDEGLDTTDAKTKLAELLAVQNTYISTFRSLGALGLLLGTFGLAAVQLRNVFERRKELALLRATGFRRFRLGLVVLLENLLLLVGGIATGASAALVTVLPHMIFGGASV
ncbi:MAG: ABC transporter permease, partial [Pirellulaceae bacterium]|nr:ABC transporter permease [Pirellulaceae bacterium]